MFTDWHDRSKVTSAFLVGVFLLWPLAIAGIFVSSYLGVAPTAALSFGVVDGWCSLGSEGLGSHCFGDFGLPYSQSISPTGPYTPGNFAATITPLGLGVFDLLARLPYNLALSIYLLSLTAPTVVVLGWASRGLADKDRLAIIVFGGLLTTGMLVTVDRGNNVGWIAPLAMLIFLSRRSWVLFIALTLLVSLKFWGVLFLIPLLVRGQWRIALGSVTAALVLNLTIVRILASDWRQGLEVSVNMVTSADVAVMVDFYSISALGFLKKASCALDVESFCSTSPEFSRGASLAVSLAVMGFLVILAVLLLRKASTPLWIKAAGIVAMILMGLPESGAYNLVLVSVVVACMVTSQDSSWNGRSLHCQRDRGLGVAGAIILGACVLTTVPAFGSLTVSHEGREAVLTAPLVIAPLAWSAAVLAMAYLASRRSRSDSIVGAQEAQRAESG